MAPLQFLLRRSTSDHLSLHSNCSKILRDCERKIDIGPRSELNVFETFEPKLPQSYRKADVVFLGNMHPSLQLSVLEQVTSKRLVGMDSMNLWIDTTPNELRDALKRVDILKIDDSEARQLSGDSSSLVTRHRHDREHRVRST